MSMLRPAPRAQEAGKIYYFQAGNTFNGEFTNTESIILNGTISENVWHRLALVVDKDSNSTVKIIFDDSYVGSFKESLAPRDVGGVMTLNFYQNIVLFKDFTIGRCIQFNSIGKCKLFLRQQYALFHKNKFLRLARYFYYYYRY